MKPYRNLKKGVIIITILVTSMTIINSTKNGSGVKLKAIADITVNNDYRISGIRLFETSNGFYARFPSIFVGGKYEDIVFPMTAQTRAQITDCLVRTYNSLASVEETKLPYRKHQQTPCTTSDIYVTLAPSDGKVKATGKAILDKQIVITKISVFDYTNTSGKKVKLVSMPSSLGKDGIYHDCVNLCGSDFRNKLEAAVLKAYDRLKTRQAS